MNRKLIIIALLAISTAVSAQEKVEIKKVDGVRTVYTDIIINASPQEVWEVLTDTEHYPDWAVFMVNINGEIKDSAHITAFFKMNEKKDKLTDVEHHIDVREGREFSWSDKFLGGIEDHHQFIVEPANDGKTKFIQADRAKGGMSWLFGNALMKLEAENYPKFNQSLKREVERRKAAKS